MSRRRRKGGTRAQSNSLPSGAPAEPIRNSPWTGRTWVWAALIGLCVLLFHWTPLTSPTASIQWDAADLHYPVEKYFSDRLHFGKLPFWTPYVYSGYPLLAYPEMAAWYAPHWPVYLAGVTPRGIQFQLALHAFLACLGAWLLLSRTGASRAAALFGAFAYGLSGFFAGHSSHVGIFSTAAGLPWLLLAFRCAMDAAAPLRYVAAGGLAGGLMILAGHFQAAMYAYLGLGLYAAAEIVRAPRRWLRALAAVAGMLALGIAISAVQSLPGLELTGESGRAASDYSQSAEGALTPGALATLVAPNALGAVSGGYKGPFDITQFYFYAGFLLIPFAALGLLDKRARIVAAAVIAPAVWYMLGPGAGLYRLGAFVPGLYKVRAPVHGWFVVALGLAVLAASGFDWIARRRPFPYFAPIALLVLFADVTYWNSWSNPLAYARSSYEDLYGAKEEFVRSRVATTQPPLSRFDAPRVLTAMGPLDHPLNLGLETTYGYLALGLKAYDEYTGAMARNPKLRDGLNVSRVLSVERQRVEDNPTVLPRAYFPRAVADVRTAGESLAALEKLDPAMGSIVAAPHPEIRQDPGAEASVTAYDEDSYRIRYRTASQALLRLSVPAFPGWRAQVEGRSCPIVKVDHALMGIIVPPGSHELEVRFVSTYFGAGLAVTALGLLAALGGIVWGARLKDRARPGEV